MSPPAGVAAPFADLIEESLDEAAFLWRRWESELASLTRSLDEVWSWTEDRLHGALDGVRIARTGEIITSALGSDEIGRVAASTGALASSPDPAAVDAVSVALRRAEGDVLAAMLRGLELLGSNQALRAAAAVLTERGPAGAAALCRLKAFLRAAPAGEMQTAFASDSAGAQIEALRAASHAQSSDAEELLTKAFQNRDPAVRLAAIEGGLCRGNRTAWDLARGLAQQRNAEAAPYLTFLALLGTAEDHEVVFTALGIPALQSQAVRALGHIGTVRAIESCLAGMKYEHLARACGEAYCWITGADLERDSLAVREVPPEPPEFEDDDLDANLVPPAESLWPLPDPDAAREDWQARVARFAPDVRHIHSRPATADVRLAMIEHGPMLRRPDLVLELRARTRGQYDVETRAFASRQRQMMAASRAAVGTRGA